MSIGTRIKEARREAKLTQKQLAGKVGIKQSTLSELESGASSGTTYIATFASALGVRALWLETGKGNKKQEEATNILNVDIADEDDKTTGEIVYWDVRGSCGGGFLNGDPLPKGSLIKEASFFNKYGLKPQNAFAIYADGDSMAEFIVDGDIVIFDKSKTTPISGKIFAIEHPDGLRIKVLRRMIDGSWILESKNPDKRSFPDEQIPAGHAELLKLHGQFVYRQGG